MLYLATVSAAGGAEFGDDGMNRLLIALACCWCVAGCGLADSQVTFVPDRYKLKAPAPPAPEPMPDVKALVQQRGKELFMGTIESILVSPPRLKDTHWEFCARPIGRGAGGQPLSAHTYLVEIEHGVIGDRLPVDGSHWCNGETFEKA
jgi:hypothetical protein